MKTCHKCGAYVEDKAQYCPECGATIVKSYGNLSLKEEVEVKKKGNPMGTTVSTGSGLTDILRAEDHGDLDESFYGGGPVTFTDPYANDDYVAKEKTDFSAVKTLIKLIILAAIIYAGYYVIHDVILARKDVTSYEEAFEIYVEAVNEQDSNALKEIMAPYINDRLGEVEYQLEQMEGVEFTEWEIVSAEEFTETEEKALQQEITLNGKSFGIQRAYHIKANFYGTVDGSKRGAENVDMVFIKGDNKWFFDPSDYDNSTFTQ